ncbi:MAG: MBL fold metallo-hydrolase [Candidatus Hodarchaeota archaeon]
MTSFREEDLQSLNGKELAPGIVLIRPMTRRNLTSNSLLFLDETKLIIDSGFQFNTGQLQKLNDIINPDILLFSHYHLDHVFGSHEFSNTKKKIHSSEISPFSSLDNFLKFCYHDVAISKEMTEIWKKRLHFFLDLENLSDWKELTLDSVEPFERTDTFDLGDMKIHVLHLPGHSPGHCGFYESTNSILFIGDLDISKALFAWYGWKNSDLGKFRSSVLELKRFIENKKIPIIVPSHSRPVSNDESIARLEALYNVFDYRKNQILNFVANKRKGTSISEIAKQSFIYQGRKSDPPFVWELFEKIHIEKHVEELLKEGSLKKEGSLVFV